MTDEELQDLHRKLDTMIHLQRVALLGEERVHRFVSSDEEIAFYLPDAAADFIQSRILRNSDFYASRLLGGMRPFIRPGAIVVDAGANIGNHTVYFSKVCQAAVVHSFEPQRHVFRILERNVELNSLSGVVAHNCALGAEAGVATIANSRGKNLGAAVFEVGDVGGYDVSTIDSLKLERLDFLKIDVEGAQVQVLEGAKATIQNCLPAVCVELRLDRGDDTEASDWLVGLGYEASHLGAEDYLFVPPVQDIQ